MTAPARFAAALSEHPVAAHAVGEVVGRTLDLVGPAPDLALLFVSGAHRDAIDEVTGAVEALLQPGTLVGCTAGAVIAGDREVEDEPAVALWAGHTGAATPVRLEAVRTPEGMALIGSDPDTLASGHTLILLADPFSFPVEAVLDGLAREHPDLQVVGGMASAGMRPGDNRLVLNATTHAAGAVGVVLAGPVVPRAVVSQGCRPIGAPYVATRTEGNRVYDIAGRPALERLRETVAELPDDEQALAARGLHVGVVIDEHQVDFGRGDFLIRGVLGADPEAGALVVGDEVAVGTTVQFHVRDAASADDDLRLLLAGEQAEAALVFSCNGRGMRLFGEPDHDARLVDRVVQRGAAAGMFCAGEIGPVGDRSFVHGFTASLLLFD